MDSFDRFEETQLPPKENSIPASLTSRFRIRTINMHKKCGRLLTARPLAITTICISEQTSSFLLMSLSTFAWNVWTRPCPLLDPPRLLMGLPSQAHQRLPGTFDGPRHVPLHRKGTERGYFHGQSPACSSKQPVHAKLLP